MRKPIIFILFMTIGFSGLAQIGGQRVFEFLNIPNNARLSGLGGTNITSGWNDPTQVTSNPALINSDWNQELAISYLGYLAGISNTSLTYANDIKNTGTWAFNLSYFNYGEIESFDAEGFSLGMVSVKEYAFSVGHAMQFGAFSAGANAKVVVSDMAGFQASALMLDLGGTFKHPEKDLTAGLLIKNMGFLISDYSSTNNSKLPLDVQLGFSYKPEFMPLRFSVTAKNLLRSDLVYFDQGSSNILGGTSEPGFSEEVFRRLVFGTELIFSQNFQLRVGYNHMLRQELKLENASGAAGFSFGFMFKVKRFEFAYTRALYHAAGGSNTFQINMNTGGLIKK